MVMPAGLVSIPLMAVTVIVPVIVSTGASFTAFTVMAAVSVAVKVGEWCLRWWRRWRSSPPLAPAVWSHDAKGLAAASTLPL